MNQSRRQFMVNTVALGAAALPWPAMAAPLFDSIYMFVPAAPGGGWDGTARAIEAAGMKVTPVNKVAEGRPHIVDMVKNGEIVLVVNTVVESRKAIQDSYTIRRASLQQRVPLYTTLAGARAACAGMKEAGELRAYAVQGLHKRLAAGAQPAAKKPMIRSGMKRTRLSLKAITTRVGRGNVAPSPANSDAKVGMTFHKITATTSAAIERPSGLRSRSCGRRTCRRPATARRSPPPTSDSVTSRRWWATLPGRP